MDAVNPRSRSTALPSFVSPELATLSSEVPEGKGWLHEVKYDGYRLIAARAGDRVRLWTRSGLDWTAKFPSVAAALVKLDAKSFLLDGEVVVFDSHGKSDFGCLQRALSGEGGSMVLCVFDLLEIDGEDLRKKPLIERKERLRRLLGRPPAGLRYSEHVTGDGEKVLAHACKLGLEGIVSKRADAPYVSARTFSWIKVKCLGRDEFVIAGFRPSDKKGRPFSSLILGEYVGDELTYRGRVGTGFGGEAFYELGDRLRRLERAKSPFKTAVPREIARDAHWVEPRLVAEIAYTERTSDGVLRHPAFLGLRKDKTAKDVQMNIKVPPGKLRSRAKNEDDDFEGVRLTHPGKILFPVAKLTKLDYAKYLAGVSDRMLPYVKDRPLSLVRCPDGSGGECFFQKHRTSGMPSELESVNVTEDSGKPELYVAIHTRAGLISAAQVGALEIHIWGSRSDDLERPDRLVFDLDPDEGLDFADVKRAATDIRDLLKSAGIETFPLVTGGKGIHVVAPLARRQDWATVKDFAKGFATRLAANEPDRFVATMSKARRKGRIFIDWLRNERGSTAIAPYSLRARPNAPVAMPLSWRQLASVERANAFTASDVLARVKSANDPWAGYAKIRQRISADALRFFAASA